MFYATAMVLSLVWLMGMTFHFTLGGSIHVLLVIAVILAMLNFYFGRKEA